MSRRIFLKIGLLLGCMFLTGWCGGIRAEAGTIYTSPYVTFSPDRKAWTTDAGNQAVEWYAEDGSDDVITGVTSALRQLNAGEHYYSIRRSGSIPIGVWKVRLSKVNCCHNGYPDTDDYHGIAFVRQTCLKPHFSAWQPICADCGQPIAYNHFYMSKAAVKSIDYMELNDRLAYYYLCPFNSNLEQGTLNRWHNCKAISANKYKVEYMPNTDGDRYGGYMLPSIHFYDNAELYEGNSVTPQTHLNRNTYSRTGWMFCGWNTRPDGTGEFYEDEAEIFNLCTGDCNADAEHATVQLYAMWKKAAGKLSLIINDGTYKGVSGNYTIEGNYGESYCIETDQIQGNACRAYFQPNGGGNLGNLVCKKQFTGWRQIEPFQGMLSDNIYYFNGPDGTWDCLEAVFEPGMIALPIPVRNNYSFGGWYYDSGLTKFAGSGGEWITLTENTTFYAYWVQLKLESTDDYESYDGYGAVDLSWSQPDGRNKIYKIYQSTDKEHWSHVVDRDSVKTSYSYVKIQEYDGFSRPIKIPYRGFYTVQAYGAQGANYGSYKGGLGGMVQAKFFFEEGETLYCCAGGQQGFNGGGEGTLYANGGGFSSVRTDRYDMLMIGGGGGGASMNVDGEPGGASQSLVALGRVGESGICGGGGGDLGGRAGEHVTHTHVEGICNHIHSGDPSEMGGCYTVPVVCGETLTHAKTRTHHWYWGGSDTTYCPACGADATKGETCTGHDTDYYKHVCPIHGRVVDNTSSSKPKTCPAIKEYAPGCGKTEDYICGYTQGQVISMKPAYGGSNYVNADAAIYYLTGIGRRYGDGQIAIWSELVGYREDTDLQDVNANDREAPERIAEETVSKKMVNAAFIEVSWPASKDNGSTYYHRVQSYSAGDGQLISTSNITQNTLTSGLRGYYYCVDTNPDTVYRASRFSLTTEMKIQVWLNYQDQYFHLAAVDKAGNVSEVTHIALGSQKKGPPGVIWPLHTNPLQIATSDAVYLKPNTDHYYVKCDGKTAFTLNYIAYMDGAASDDYQMNYCIVEGIGENGISARNIVYVPSGTVIPAAVNLDTEQFRFFAEGSPRLQEGSFISGMRSSSGKELRICRTFLLDPDAEGERIKLIPVAGADHKDQIVYSDHAEDIEHAVEVIGDGTPPVISGMDALDRLALLDRRDGAVTCEFMATDTLSGVQEFYLEIINLDNDATQKRYPDTDDVIRVSFTEDLPIFSGDFIVRAYARDNVGNESVIEREILEFDLKAQVQRLKEPYEPYFKRGESGCLKITTWGYAERVEIEFPEELTRLDEELNHTYIYELKPGYRQEENYEFLIPLQAPEGEEFRITVRAYKGDRMLERHPAIAVLGIEGSILDELHTILR